MPSYLNFGNIARGSTTKTKVTKLAMTGYESNLCCRKCKSKNGRNESIRYLKT